MPPAGKAGAKAGAPDNFRARRLSVSDIDTSEFDKAKAGGESSSSSTPAKGGRRERRMSMSPEMGVVRAKEELPFPLDLVGTYSCHGVEPGMRAGETSAKINQDRGCVSYPFAPERSTDYKMALFCVYDGHGALGDKVSQFTAMQVETQLAEHPSLIDDPPKALKDVFVHVDEMLKKNASIDAELSGTTGVVLLMRSPMKDGVVSKEMSVWSACVGDSRAVECIGGATRDLSDDQKPDTPAEMARIKKCGGFVSPPEEEWGGPARVWLDPQMTLPGLAMARSIGDHLVKSVGVTAEPEVKLFKYNQDFARTDFFVMASDGVWEFIESAQATMLVSKFINKGGGGTTEDSTVAVTKLIETAAAKWRQEEGDYRDDITAIVIRLKDILSTKPPA